MATLGVNVPDFRPERKKLHEEEIRFLRVMTQFEFRFARVSMDTSKSPVQGTEDFGSFLCVRLWASGVYSSERPFSILWSC
jgi:hypothetical protein